MPLRCNVMSVCPFCQDRRMNQLYPDHTIMDVSVNIMVSEPLVCANDSPRPLLFPIPLNVDRRGTLKKMRTLIKWHTFLMNSEALFI